VFGDTPPLHRVNLAHGVRSKSDFQTLIDAFYVCMFTPYVGLRVKNWQDYQATSTNSRVLQVTGTTYKLQRKHTFGGVSYYRDIKKPITGKVAVYNASNALLSSTPDYTDGTVVVATGTPAYWIGEFDLPMAFTDNSWKARLEVSTYNLHIVNDPIMLEEILL